MNPEIRSILRGFNLPILAFMVAWYLGRPPFPHIKEFAEWVAFVYSILFCAFDIYYSVQRTLERRKETANIEDKDSE